eukprot:m.160658 g.160658  ORF g.160658 m.160658 type:complete len:488 (+) comp31193_c0_seq1:170-1633(+)
MMMTRLFGLLWAFVLFNVIVATEDEHGHGSEVAHYEWGGSFETTNDMYVFELFKTGIPAVYAQTGVRMAVFPVQNGTDEALAGVEEEAMHALELNCSTVAPNTIVKPQFDECQWVLFDDRMYQTTVLIETSNMSHIAIFMEHAPTEFNAEFISPEGVAVIALHTVPVGNTTSTPTRWGEAIGASLVVWLCTLVGMVLMIPCLSSARKKYETKFDVLLSAFASGAILSTAVFFLFIEAAHMLESKWVDEVEVKWRWGLCVLCGFISVNVVDAFVELLGKPVPEELPTEINFDYTEGKEAIEPQQDVEEGALDKATPPSRWRQVVGIIIGEVLHNFVDGIFIGAAFTGCGSGFGWTVAFATVYHELAQEMADFFLLIGPAGLKPLHAMLINIVSGSSVTIGVVVILLVDVPTETTGLILAFGAGIYMEIGTVESMARVHKAGVSGWTKLAAVGVFMIGAVSIGLVLLDHEHCEAVSAHGGDETGSHEAH